MSSGFVTCKYCGKDYYVTEHRSGGEDWLGHRRSDLEIWTTGECSCKSEEKIKSISIKKMCMNCRFNEWGHCKNKDTIKEFKEKLSNFEGFDLSNIKSLPIKNTTSKCQNYRIDTKLLEPMIKKDSEKDIVI